MVTCESSFFSYDRTKHIFFWGLACVELVNEFETRGFFLRMDKIKKCYLKEEKKREREREREKNFFYFFYFFICYMLCYI